MLLHKSGLGSIGTLIVLAAGLSALTLSSTVFAHNNVVVIPMAGDDIVPKPTSPLTKESPPNSDYIVNGLISVVDKVTGLEWQRLDDNTQRSFDAAFQYCIDLSLDGINDWRLPLITELLSIVDHGANNPSINTAVFPATNTSFHWSASSFASGYAEAWGVRFLSGHVTALNKGLNFYVRCVR